jgi:hypothetical protein
LIRHLLFNKTTAFLVFLLSNGKMTQVFIKPLQPSHIFSQTVAAGSLNFIYEIWKTDPTGVRNEWKWPSSHESMHSWLQQPFKQQHSLFTLDNNCQLLKVSQIENSKCRIAAALGGEMKSAETLY